MQEGLHSLDEMVGAELRGNSTMAWLLRLMGFAFMWFGLQVSMGGGRKGITPASGGKASEGRQGRDKGLMRHPGLVKCWWL